MWSKNDTAASDVTGEQLFIGVWLPKIKTKIKWVYFWHSIFWTTITVFLKALSSNCFPSSNNFFSYCTKICSWCLLRSFRKVNIFNDQNIWWSKGAIFAEYGRWVKSSQARTLNFYLVITKCYPAGIFWILLISCYLWFNWRLYLFEFI